MISGYQLPKITVSLMYFNCQDQLRAGNLKPSQLKDDESITGPMSTLKALGFENPTTIGSLWNVDYVVGATGGLYSYYTKKEKCKWKEN